MKRVREWWLVCDEAGIVKMERRRRARVVLPEEEGPERPMRRVWVGLRFVVISRFDDGFFGEEKMR